MQQLIIRGISQVETEETFKKVPIFSQGLQSFTQRDHLMAIGKN